MESLPPSEQRKIERAPFADGGMQPAIVPVSAVPGIETTGPAQTKRRKPGRCPASVI